MTPVEPATERPWAAIVGLVICWVVGCVMTVVLPVFLFLAIGFGPVRTPTAVEQFAIAVILWAASYVIGGLAGRLAILGASPYNRRVYRTGVLITYLSAAATAVAAAAVPQLFNDFRILAATPVALASAGTLLVVFWRRTWVPLAWEASNLWDERAATGRPQLAQASLVVFGAGYAFMLHSSGMVSALVAMITSTVSLFLALRALPNIMAIVVLIAASVLLLVLMFGGALLPRPA